MPITSKRSLKILLIPTLLLIFGNLPGRAASGEKVNYRELPFNNSLLQSIETTFCSKQQPSQKKILRYYDLIERRYGEVKQNLGSYYSQIKKHSKKKTKKKTKKKGEIKSYRILLKYIRQLQDLEDPVEFRLLAAKILHLDYALRINARKLATIEMLEKIPFSLRPKRIPLTAAPHGEASNLANPAGGFYSQKQLAALKARGEDISSLHPPKDSTFWVDHAISEIDVPRHYMTGQDPLHKGMEIIFPHQKAYFDKVRTTQSKPKLDIYIRRNGKKIRFKLKLGAEVYSETTCAALYTALGFSADITKYVSDFKVVLGDVDYLQFKRDWESYYSGYNPDKYIKEKGEDEEGHYIIFYEGVMEAKPDGLLRVGPWAYGTNGNGGRREVRGSLLFNMWVSNLDLKEAENNKLILRKIDGRTRFFNIQHDMGFAFGKTYMERPGSFMWDLVKKKTDEYVYMNFKGIVDNSLFHKVTFADARWMARLIARLSRRQITDAVDLGGWPKQVRGLLVEKLIARRNQLVTAFELEGEKTPEDETIGLMEFDRTLTTADGVVKNGNLKIYRFKNHPQYFGPRVNEFIAMILRGLRNTAVGSVVGVASSMRYLTLKPEWFDLDPKIVSKIILRMDRQIQRNPLPKSDKDSYLVQDTL
ncbi:MAG: hypothetical protein GY765_11100, partial [bacterium]|nr:hypothetical protein [bacterium]